MRPALPLLFTSWLVLSLACAAKEIEGDTPAECTDRADNDADGDYDCQDEDCAGSPDCYKPPTSDGDTDSDSDSDSDTDADSCAENPPTGDRLSLWEPAAFVDNAEVSGTDGWASGYAEDPWRGFVSGGTAWAYATTDETGGSWGAGGPTDNWLLNEGRSFQEGGIQADFWTEDDDSVGLVLADEAGTLYLFVLCGAEDRPNPTCPLSLEGPTGSALVRLSDHELTVLAETPDSYPFGELFGDLALYRDQGELVGVSESLGLELRAAVSGSTPLGPAGFYSYNSDLASFSEPLWFQLDDDDDGTPNDDDACPLDADRQ